MPASPLPYHVTAMHDHFTEQRLRLDRAVSSVSASGEALLARHEANRRATSELIALRKKRNVLGLLIEDHPKIFAVSCVILFLSYSFWNWWLTSPETQAFSSPLRQMFSGWAW